MKFGAGKSKGLPQRAAFSQPHSANVLASPIKGDLYVMSSLGVAQEYGKKLARTPTGSSVNSFDSNDLSDAHRGATTEFFEASSLLAPSSRAMSAAPPPYFDDELASPTFSSTPKPAVVDPVELERQKRLEVERKLLDLQAKFDELMTERARERGRSPGPSSAVSVRSAPTQDADSTDHDSGSQRKHRHHKHRSHHHSRHHRSHRHEQSAASEAGDSDRHARGRSRSRSRHRSSKDSADGSSRPSSRSQDRSRSPSQSRSRSRSAKRSSVYDHTQASLSRAHAVMATVFDHAPTPATPKPTPSELSAAAASAAATRAAAVQAEAFAQAAELTKPAQVDPRSPRFSIPTAASIARAVVRNRSVSPDANKPVWRPSSTAKAAEGSRTSIARDGLSRSPTGRPRTPRSPSRDASTDGRSDLPRTPSQSNLTQFVLDSPPFFGGGDMLVIEDVPVMQPPKANSSYKTSSAPPAARSASKPAQPPVQQQPPSFGGGETILSSMALAATIAPQLPAPHSMSRGILVSGSGAPQSSVSSSAPPSAPPPPPPPPPSSQPPPLPVRVPAPLALSAAPTPLPLTVTLPPAATQPIAAVLPTEIAQMRQDMDRIMASVTSLLNTSGSSTTGNFMDTFSVAPPAPAATLPVGVLPAAPPAITPDTEMDLRQFIQDQLRSIQTALPGGNMVPPLGGSDPSPVRTLHIPPISSLEDLSPAFQLPTQRRDERPAAKAVVAAIDVDAMLPPPPPVTSKSIPAPPSLDADGLPPPPPPATAQKAPVPVFLDNLDAELAREDVPPPPPPANKPPKAGSAPPPPPPPPPAGSGVAPSSASSDNDSTTSGTASRHRPPPPATPPPEGQLRRQRMAPQNATTKKWIEYQTPSSSKKPDAAAQPAAPRPRDSVAIFRKVYGNVSAAEVNGHAPAAQPAPAPAHAAPTSMWVDAVSDPRASMIDIKVASQALVRQAASGANASSSDVTLNGEAASAPAPPVAPPPPPAPTPKIMHNSDSVPVARRQSQISVNGSQLTVIQPATRVQSAPLPAAQSQRLVMSPDGTLRMPGSPEAKPTTTSPLSAYDPR